MGEIDAISEARSGAALARSVEPESGAVGADGHTHEAACLNCGTPLAGDYCHSCGQRGHVHRTLGAFFHDLLHGVFHFEGKIWNTLPRLVWRPGDLTRDYVEGKRVSVVSPIALFLFSVFLMFAAVNSLISPIKFNEGSSREALAKDSARSQRKVVELSAERARLVAAGKAVATIDRQIADAREEARLLTTMSERGLVRGAAIRVSDDTPAWIGGPLRQAVENPELLLYKVQNNAYKFSWALIPLSVPFLWLLFPFSRRFRLYDHIVFVTYSLSFMTLLVIVATILAAVGWSVLAGLMMVVPPLHIYRQIKAAYGLTRLGALWRTALLTIFALLTVTLFIALLFMLGLF